MSPNPCVSNRTPAAADHVALLLPATAEVPKPPQRINFVKALLLYWLAPGRVGPHLAVDTGKRALAAHVISVILAIGVAKWATLATAAGWLRTQTPVYGLHESLARGILEIAVTPLPGSWMAANWVMALGGVVLIEMGLVAVAILAMPWCAGGDSAWSVFKRSLKNVYWTTTLTIPMAVIYLLVSLSPIPTRIARWYSLSDLTTLLAAPAVLFLTLRALTAGAGRYVGEPVGPAFGPREPLCEGCGYRITGLPLTGRCPECGMVVRDSLPGGRRRMTVWQQCEFSPRGVAELVRMQKRVLCDPGFFETVPVQQGLSSARHFWWGTFLLIGLVSLVTAQAVPIITQIVAADPRYHWYDRAEGVLASLAALSVPFAGQTVVLFAACLWAQVRLGIRDYRVSATVCYYASPLMWPLMVVVLVSAFVASSRLGEMIGSWPGVRILGVALAGSDLLGMVVGLLAIGAIWFWWQRLCRGLRAARYANG